MNNSQMFDLVVIGSGPAGEGAAIQAANKGLRVAVVERDAIGGGSTHKGTIPSKALRHGVRKLIQASKSHLFQMTESAKSINFDNVLRLAASVTQRQAARKMAKFNESGVTLFKGEALFVGSREIRVVQPGTEDGGEILTFKNALIATGSRPYRPAEIDFTHHRVYDSDTILGLEYTPKRVVIYGAGVIGCEYASIFSGLGVQVDLIDTRDRLLNFLDDEISAALSYHLSGGNVVVKHNETFDWLEANDDNVVVHLKSGKTVRGDLLLWCNGRTGNADGLGIESVGISANSRGQIDVDKAYQTAASGIYAAGDVIGWPSLASASYDQGRAVVDAMLDPALAWTVSDVPTGIYTIPEISSVGKTESELTKEGVPYEVGRAYFKDLARAQISEEEAGMLKILFHRDSLEVLGIHCFGYQASEIVHIGQAIMLQEGEGNSVKFFTRTTFNYPTMAEGYRVAALDGLARIGL
ncbi:NAD(P) transhydrogenase [Pseudomonas nitritireducens]|uniref:Soluble pyridine nucleotide transhydrogenase n=1 Tax=Pseudomonas nitroreducens TaxID=46680 RepID=A0A7W7KE88_PSENT|nr:Si-specific NAD(P)(+) transhydrogenase [Pseudomonas nitritireducens]MBB4861236.1 NAD(P) transhydrogenase [Pseudomonas nitritireducens]